MKRYLASALLSLFLVPSASAVGLTDNQALMKAQMLWGQNAYLNRTRTWWKVWRRTIYQVGCIPDGSPTPLIVGQATGSWDNAFALVDPKTNGLHILTAIARDTMNQLNTSDPVQVFICNAASGIAFFPIQAPRGKVSGSKIESIPLPQRNEPINQFQDSSSVISWSSPSNSPPKLQLSLSWPLAQ